MQKLNSCLQKRRFFQIYKSFVVIFCEVTNVRGVFCCCFCCCCCCCCYKWKWKFIVANFILYFFQKMRHFAICWVKRYLSKNISSLNVSHTKIFDCFNVSFSSLRFQLLIPNFFSWSILFSLSITLIIIFLHSTLPSLDNLAKSRIIMLF